ncbi:MAG TPA: FAD-dependent monooxygenase [Phototrophicaceae bacterium]|nr:FAD-dependent monooxygenase [Phototrophicaceae bacterium]
MKILIAGAGPAGLTLAYWLHKDGHTPVLIEKAPDIRTAGYMIDFAGSGWDVANRMGLIPQLQSVSQLVEKIVYKDADGHTTASMSVAKLYNAWGIEGHFLALNRRDLVEALYHAVETDVEIRFGTTLMAVCQSTESVTATFDNGQEETFDLLIGADGIHSHARALAFGSEAEFANYLGYYVAVFYAPAITDEENFSMHVEPGVQVGIYPLPSDRCMVVVTYKSADEGMIPPAERLNTLKRHLKGVGWITHDLLEHLPPDTSIFMDTVTQIEMPRWSCNRVALVGDAAYCLTLISGEGTSMAMAGAYFLAEELRRNADHHTAFQRYDQRLRPHIEQKQKKARKFAPNFVPSSQMRIVLTQWAIRLIDLPPITHLVGKQLNLKSIVTD